MEKANQSQYNKPSRRKVGENTQQLKLLMLGKRKLMFCSIWSFTNRNNIENQTILTKIQSDEEGKKPPGIIKLGLFHCCTSRTVICTETSTSTSKAKLSLQNTIWEAIEAHFARNGSWNALMESEQPKNRFFSTDYSMKDHSNFQTGPRNRNLRISGCKGTKTSDLLRIWAVFRRVLEGEGFGGDWEVIVRFVWWGEEIAWNGSRDFSSAC